MQLHERNPTERPVVTGERGDPFAELGARLAGEQDVAAEDVSPARLTGRAFSSSTHVVLPPTTDAAAVEAALERVPRPVVGTSSDLPRAVSDPARAPRVRRAACLRQGTTRCRVRAGHLTSTSRRRRRRDGKRWMQ